MITAARLGSAPLHWDFTHLASLTPPLAAGRAFSPDTEELSSAWNQLKKRFAAGEVGFYDAVVDDSLSSATASTELAQKLLATQRFTDVLFLGIGGSALGPLSLLDALHHRRSTSLRFHFIDNPDAIHWQLTLTSLQPESTLVCSVTKSGTTFETLAQTAIALEWLGRNRWSTHVVAITDPEKGDLRKLANAEKLMTLPIAPAIGGRFSIFSPVGLFAAALAGLSVAEFMQGARLVREFCEKTPHEKNPIHVTAAHLIRHYPKRTVHVCMPYSTRLKLIGQWWVQLWGESLGKDGKGFSPLAAVGATDQHSLVQLLRDGPDDKITTFITDSSSARRDSGNSLTTIPRLSSPHATGLAAFHPLAGQTLQGLLQIEFQATAKVMANQRRPYLSLVIDQLDERNLGALYFAYSVLTAMTGTLWGVNPFDQPGVEEAKVYIRESLAAQRAETQDREAENSAADRLRRQ